MNVGLRTDWRKRVKVMGYHSGLVIALIASNGTIKVQHRRSIMAKNKQRRYSGGGENDPPIPPKKK